MEIEDKEYYTYKEKLDPNAILKPPKDYVVNKNIALNFKILKKCSTTKARASTLELPHYKLNGGVPTPIFMHVGTQGTIKGITTSQLKDLSVPIILGNTYHLSQKPGTKVLNSFGGLHKFMNWDRAILTDSGGFQMVSLLDLSKMSEEGVIFQSPNDGSEMLLTPEESMKVQNSIGGDIMMALDDVVSSLTCGPRVEEAMYRTLRWIDRCIKAHKNSKNQNLFGIVQGGLDIKLREICCKELIKRNLPGYAIGGLSGGEKKSQFWKIVDCCTNFLPDNKPRYCMGVGYALDILCCVSLGVDMFDCVFPTRTARFGSALIRNEKFGSNQITLNSSKYKNDFNSLNYKYIQEKMKSNNYNNNYKNVHSENYSKAFLKNIAAKEPVGCHLVSMNNIAHQINLMKDIRESILHDQFPQFVVKFMKDSYKTKINYPKWAINCFEKVGIKL